MSLIPLLLVAFLVGALVLMVFRIFMMLIKFIVIGLIIIVAITYWNGGYCHMAAGDFVCETHQS